MYLLYIKSYYSKKQNQQNMNYTQKHNSINIYNKSIRLLLLHFLYQYLLFLLRHNKKRKK